MKTDKLVRAETVRRNFPPGITKIDGGVHICTVASGDSCSLIVYEAGKKEGKRFPFPDTQRIGDTWSMDLLADDFSGLEYCLEVDGEEIPDPYGMEFTGREQWGDLNAVSKPMRSRFVTELFDWDGDRTLKTPYEDTVIYHIHPRGFTKHSSSQCAERGTFQAVASKIPYMKELGVTAVELMPPNEFDEVIMPDGSDGNPYAGKEPTGRLNYWGYGSGYYFAPKSSYSAGPVKKPALELKSLVKKLHENGLEIIIELYFSGKESPSFVQDAVRFWVSEYHVDGVHLVGYAAAGLLAEDPMLADTKLLAVSWDNRSGEGTAERRRRHLGEYNDGFMIDMRRVLKGDEEQMNNLIFRNRRNPAGYGVINYMACTNGYTMMDMVTYEAKHNEANGEENRDGSSYNYTWNCGVEGPSRKKKIVQMRKKQLRNAFLLLFLSQGTPLLMAGDEFCGTQNGNNNAYCQDNETSWVNWNLLKTNRDICEFVKYVIRFRKEHPVFHMGTEPRNVDYLVCGHPDVSYHGVNAWCPEFESFRRQMGIMYCGAYAKKADGQPDDYFFVAYNMHWEPHEFALPNLPKGMQWYIIINTDDGEKNGIYENGMEPKLKDQKNYMVPARSIVVFTGLKKVAAAKEQDGNI